MGEPDRMRKISRRCHFLLFVFFVARGRQTQEWGRRWLNLRACYHFPPLFLNWYRWQRFQITSQMVSHMQDSPRSISFWPWFSSSPGVDKRKKMKIADLIQGQLPLPTIVSPLQQVTENLNNVPISVQHASLAEFYIFFTLEKCHPKL